MKLRKFWAVGTSLLDPSLQQAINFYRPQSLRGLCFYTCLSVILFTRGAGCASVYAGIADPPEADPPEQTPPCAVHAGRYGQQADGTHPTGMRTFIYMLLNTNSNGF